jgi:transposase
MRRLDREREVEIVRLALAEGWPIGTVAKQLGVHHSVVRRVLRERGVPLPTLSPRRSKLDPYMGFLLDVLEKYPKLQASRLWQMLCARGYDGGDSRVRELVRLVRPSPQAEAYLRLAMLPGEQGQVDWAHFGTLLIGRATRNLLAFIMVLSFSRKIFVRFFLDARMPNFLRGHVEAFEAFGGVPRNLLYDNLKSAVVERLGDAIRFNEMLLELAKHYRFGPRAAAPARGNEKGRVERAIRYLRGSFFAGREVTDLDTLNADVAVWCRDISDARRWPDDRERTVAEVFEQEKTSLLALPDDAFPCNERVDVVVGKQPYVRFDRNDYSVPHELVRQSLVVVADLQMVRVCRGIEVVATHNRSWDARQTIEDPRHIQGLVEHKRRARAHRGIDRLRSAATQAERFLQRAAERGRNLGSITAKLLELLDEHGGAALDDALREVLERDVIHVPSVRQVLEQRRHAEGKPLPVAMAITNPRLRDVVVRPHDLSIYDQLNKEADDDDDDATP